MFHPGCFSRSRSNLPRTFKSHRAIFLQSFTYLCKVQPPPLESPHTQMHTLHTSSEALLLSGLCPQKPPSRLLSFSFLLHFKIFLKKICFILNCLTFRILVVTFLSIDSFFFFSFFTRTCLAGPALTLPVLTECSSPNTEQGPTSPDYSYLPRLSTRPSCSPHSHFSQGDEDSPVGLYSVTEHSYSPG